MSKLKNITIEISHTDGHYTHIEVPSDGRVDTLVEQCQQWVVNEDAAIGETLETVITGVHIDIKDTEGRINITEERK